MENSIDVPQKIKNRTTLQCSNSPFENPKTKKHANFKRYMHPYICYSIFKIAKI